RGRAGLLRRVRSAWDVQRPDILKNVSNPEDFRAKGVDTPLLGFMRHVGFDAAERTIHCGTRPISAGTVER
ncbi:MAG TPA: hypothetical protein VN085_07510, partial [Vicinamibacterales bacterium]|nr:hypothetical protein [Vicinamibacterales bacterium]